MLLRHLQTLRPTYPYYAIRRINLLNGRYKPDWNPDFHPALVSNKVRFVGKLHEHVEPHRPYSVIDYPIVHNHVTTNKSYSSGWKDTAAYRPVMILKKLREISRGR